MCTRSLWALWARRLWALSACLTSSFTPFGCSSRPTLMTTATMLATLSIYISTTLSTFMSETLSTSMSANLFTTMC